MEPRPGRIRRIVPVELAHPRDRSSPGFGQIKDQVLGEFAEHGAELAAPAWRPDAAPRPLSSWQFAI